jgi:hypothetical protein
MLSPTPKQLFWSIVSILVLTLTMGFGLSVAVNHGVKLMERQGGEFLPGTPTQENSQPY